MASSQCVTQMLQGTCKGQHGAHTAGNENSQDGIPTLRALVTDLLGQDPPFRGSQADYDAI